jgi:alcohol dehydrogenase class IV
VGGGSVLDTAKALSGLLPRQDPVDDFLEGVGKGLAFSTPGIPWIALPTTSGTGAEATKNAVVKSRALGYKRSLRSPFLLSSCVIVDPELTVECSKSLTGTVGMDALTQLIESYVTRKSSPIPRALVRQAFPIMLHSLKRLAGDLSDLDARTGAAYGALISGIALANSGLGAAHGFASGLGGLYDIPHGLICAVFLRPVLRSNAAVIAEDCLSLYRDMQIFSGARVEPLTGDRAVEWLIGEIDDLFTLFRLPDTLAGFKIKTEDIPEIARRSVGSSMSGNPRDLTQEDLEHMTAPLI